MKCLEFHRAKLADPRRLPDEARAHLAECPSCAAFAREVDETESELERALASRVPDGLADRVLLRVHGTRRRWQPWALAATVVLAAAVSITWFLRDDGDEPQYALAAIRHVAMEPESFTHAANAGRPLEDVIRASGGRLKGPLGEVRYMKLCPLEGGGVGWHIVFETPEGLATLLVAPDLALAREQSASDAQWSALVRPAGRGYYAVVTPSSQQTARIDRLLRSRIDWSASS